MMNNNFLCHVIRDVFNPTGQVVLYGENLDLFDTLYAPEHSIGAYMLHSDYSVLDPKDFKTSANVKNANIDLVKQWPLEYNNCFFGLDFCELFVSVNYDPVMLINNFYGAATNIKSMMKKNGLLFLVNPGVWSYNLDLFFDVRFDLIHEIHKYRIFKDDKILVYENV